MALHRADRQLWSCTVGETGTDSPLGPGTQFRIGSVTKTFTAALTLQCRDDGLLDLDDPTRVIARPDDFLLEPVEPWELKGDVPNVVPDYARILTWVRDSRRDGVDTVFARVKEIAEGAALMTRRERGCRTRFR